MTDNEMLALILSKFDKIETRLDKIETRLDQIETRLDLLETDMQEIKRRTTSIELHLENVTDKNIQLIAENFIELTNKLNQAIPAADKNLAYEVKVNYLIKEVDKLKEDVEKIKSKIA